MPHPILNQFQKKTLPIEREIYQTYPHLFNKVNLTDLKYQICKNSELSLNHALKMYNHYSYFYVKREKNFQKTRKLGLEDALASEEV